MSLTARLSAFFLTALALVLIGFSSTLYLLAQSYLFRQVDERLAAALDTLVAAVEIEPDGLDWEPAERRLRVGQEVDENQVRWVLRDGNGRLVDRSLNLDAADPLLSLAAAPAEGGGAAWALTDNGQDRRVLQQHLHHAPGSPSREASVPGQPVRSKHAELIVTVALSRGPVQATLRQLALALATLSVGLWSVAALLGRWFCRRALTPVTQMALAARAMSDADWDQRLPLSQTGDELEDFGRAFNDLLARLQEAYERQRRFTGDASHQLRTPLAALLGQLEVVLRRERSSEDYQQVLHKIQVQGRKLREIVETLLFLARADGDARLSQLDNVDLAVWLPAFLTRWAEQPRGADLQFELATEGPVIAAVQGPLLEQLLSNLLENACKYSAPGSPITVRLSRTDGLVACQVEDQGFGISAEDMLHVFEPFFRATDVRRRGCTGIGLGLTVVQRIAAAFGGAMAVSSTIGKGSQFTLVLPQATPSPAAELCLT